MKKILIIVLWFWIGQLETRAAPDGSALILERYRLHLLQLPRASDDSIAKWINLMDSHGRWSDINYQSNDPAAWPTLDHLDRLRAMAIYWSSDEAMKTERDKLWESIVKGINNWLSLRYQSGNWWFNEIGVPQRIRDIVALTKDRLTVSQLQGMKAVLGQFKLRGVGANLIWSADLALHAGALDNDLKLMATAREFLVKEIKLSTDEGIQPDFSYHQHQARLQIYHYGNSFLKDNIRIAWQLRGTKLAFDQNKVEILGDFVEQGWQWMARGKYTVPATVDRAATRPGYLATAGLDSYLGYLLELLPARHKVFEGMLAGQQRNSNSVNGYKYFPFSDFGAYHQPGFSFFVKTISSRTELTEKINGENLKGDFLNFGNSYLVRNGREYTDMMPVWDWAKLPGVTNFEGASTIERKDFVGGLSSDRSGFSVMQIGSFNSAQQFSAQKLWANYKNVMVCLIADIKLSSPGGKVFTVLDQARVQGPVVVDKPGNILANGRFNYEKLGWIYHAGLSYIPIGATKAQLIVDTVSGSWKRVNNSGLAKGILDTVFLPTLIHENQSDAAYAVAYTGSILKTQQLVARPSWKVLSNTGACQAVIFEKKVLMATFGKAGAYQLANKTIRVDRPCLLLMEDGKVFLSDPLFEGGKLKLSLDKRLYEVELPLNGASIQLNR